jgi:hypothetical protein
MDSTLQYDPLLTLIHGLSNEDATRTKDLIQRLIWWTKAATEHSNNEPMDFLNRGLVINEASMELGKILTLAAMAQGFQYE